MLAGRVSWNRCILLVALACSGLVTAAFAGTTTSVGGEFLVNDRTADDQFLPHVVMNVHGEYAVTWTDDTNVQVRVFNADGSPKTAETVANSTVVGNQNESQVALSDNGRSVVVWTDYNGADGEALGVLAQRFNPNGGKVGPEFIVTEVTDGSQWEAMVGMDAADNIVFVWVDSIPGDGSNAGIFGRVFNWNGVPQGGQFSVNGFIPAAQINPSLAVCPDGSFIVAWQDRSGTDGSLSRIMARSFTSQGVPLYPDIQVNVTWFDDQSHPSLVARADGSFVVVYTDWGGSDGSGGGVYLRAFDAGGNPTSSEVRVNQFTAGDQGIGEAAWDEGETTLFVVFNDFTSQDGWGGGVYYRTFDTSLNPLSADQRVNTTTFGNQLDADVAMSPSGQVTVVWEDQQGADGDGKGIFGQRYQVEILTGVPATGPTGLAVLVIVLLGIGVWSRSRLSR